MASNLRSFNLALAKHGEELPATRLQQVHRAVALEGLRGVVLMTPVDKGRARGAWSVSVGEPDLAEPGTLDKVGATTIARGAAIIATIRAFTVSWIINAVPYITELEKGHSQQAPHGMLAVTAQRLRAWLARQR